MNDVIEMFGSNVTRLARNYVSDDARVVSLYCKAKRDQWDAATDIDWTVHDRPAPAPTFWAQPPHALPFGVERLPEFEAHFHTWLVSQFLHGEQGAVVTASRLCQVLPTTDLKLLASMQVVDEARHVEVYSRYLRDVVGDEFPVNANVLELLRQMIEDVRWDLTCLGIQIVLEGIALAAFRMTGFRRADSIISQITERVLRDESRHTSFGIMTLEGLYSQMTAQEVREREEFVLTAAELMVRRFNADEVWDRMEIPRNVGRAFMRADATLAGFRRVLFTRVVFGISKVGLMTKHVHNGLEALDLLPGSGTSKEVR